MSGGIANYNVYPCLDGKYVALGALEPKFWVGFCKVINKPKWEGRISEQDPTKIQQLKADLEDVFIQKSAQEWEQLGNAADVCITAVRDLKDLTSDSFLQQTRAFNTVDVNGQPVYTVAFPVNFSGTANVLPSAPFLGEDNHLS